MQRAGPASPSPCMHLQLGMGSCCRHGQGGTQAAATCPVYEQQQWEEEAGKAAELGPTLKLMIVPPLLGPAVGLTLCTNSCSMAAVGTATTSGPAQRWVVSLQQTAGGQHNWLSNSKTAHQCR